MFFVDTNILNTTCHTVFMFFKDCKSLQRLMFKISRRKKLNAKQVSCWMILTSGLVSQKWKEELVIL